MSIILKSGDSADLASVDANKRLKGDCAFMLGSSALLGSRSTALCDLRKSIRGSTGRWTNITGQDVPASAAVCELWRER